MSTQPKHFRFLRRGALILIASGSLMTLTAANPAIGMAITNGSLQVDQARVWGNATLFEGSTLDTGVAGTRIQLNSGTRVRLASASRATVYQRRLVLQSGYSQWESTADYEVEARSLRVQAAAPGTIARVKLQDDGSVMVAAVRGLLQVKNATGLLVAKVESGTSLDFSPQSAGAAAPTTASGCLLQKAGGMILVDQTTNVVLELRGADLAREVGNRVQITGISQPAAPAVAGASQLVQVAEWKQVGKGGCSTIAQKIGASAGSGTAVAAANGNNGAAAAAAKSGIGIGRVAIIGGVAIGATAGGLAAVGDLPGQGESSPSASR